jgi:hypothetical protein
MTGFGYVERAESSKAIFGFFVAISINHSINALVLLLNYQRE